jgi:hypothetical protein
VNDSLGEFRREENLANEYWIAFLGNGASGDVAERTHLVVQLLLHLLQVIFSRELGLWHLCPLELSWWDLVLLPRILLLRLRLLVLLHWLGRRLLANRDNKIFVILAGIFGLDDWFRWQFSELPIKHFEYFMEVKAELRGVGEFLFHFFGEFFEERGGVLNLLAIVSLLGQLVVDDLVVLFHLADHLAVDGREGIGGQLLILAKVEVL